MKRRLILALSMLTLYAALMAVMWIIDTRQARDKTEWQLDFAVMDFHDTVSGAIDTMLGHVARAAVRRVGRAQHIPMDRMAACAKDLDIDEVNVVSRSGRIIASNDPHSMGVEMAGDPVMEPFMALTNGVTATVSQPFRPSASNPAFRAKYLGAAFPGGDGFVQIGLDEQRLAKMLPSILGYIFDQWLLGRTGFFLCADMETGGLISNPSRHLDEARTLDEAGYDIESAKGYEGVMDSTVHDAGGTFVQTLFGEKCYCRAFQFGGHRFVAALPEREFFDTRNIVAGVFGLLLFAVLGIFAFFIDRICCYTDRIKAFYAAEAAARSKDMEIAAMIQNSALPARPPQSPYFAIYAAMSPAREVGGDFYDYFQPDSSHIAFLVADVSGKGVTAALYMMNAKTLIKDALLASHGPAAAFDRVNDELCRNNSANMFLTAWAGVLDLETGELVYANAGHNPPAVRRKDGSVELLSSKSGPVLAFIDGFRYRQFHAVLSAGETAFLYTDGVTEAVDQKGTLFGEERLVETLAAVRPPRPESVCNVVRAAVAAFAAGAPAADDLTVLAVEYVARPERFVRTFPPTQEGVAGASDFLDSCIATRDGGAEIAPVTAAALHVILDEICSNIVKHSGASGFEVDVEFSDSETRLVFIDDGFAYNPVAHADPDLSIPAEKRPAGGLGILMVKKMSKSLSYSREHNRNFLKVSVGR